MLYYLHRAFPFDIWRVATAETEKEHDENGAGDVGTETQAVEGKASVASASMASISDSIDTEPLCAALGMDIAL